MATAQLHRCELYDLRSTCYILYSTVLSGQGSEKETRHLFPDPSRGQPAPFVLRSRRPGSVPIWYELGLDGRRVLKKFLRLEVE